MSHPASKAGLFLRYVSYPLNAEIKEALLAEWKFICPALKADLISAHIIYNRPEIYYFCLAARSAPIQNKTLCNRINYKYSWKYSCETHEAPSQNSGLL